MSVGEAGSGPIHPVPTRRSGYRYLFSEKHHGRGGPDAARWILTHDEEFGVFDLADFHDLSDERGWLYGIRRDPDGRLVDLGTWNQQVAEFPHTREREPWHGYPLWPLKALGPDNRKGEKYRPSKEVFRKMEESGLLTLRECRRLVKGDHA